MTWILVEGHLVQADAREEVCDFDLFLINDNCEISHIPRKCAHCHWIKLSPGNLKIELFSYYSQTVNFAKNTLKLYGRLGVLDYTRASHQGRSRGSSVTWSKLVPVMQNASVSMAKMAVTIATGTVSMAMKAWMVRMMAPPPRRGVFDTILINNVGLYPSSWWVPSGVREALSENLKNFEKFPSIVEIY